MNINLDDKRIKSIIYQLEDGRVVSYNFENGELLYVDLTVESKGIPTDREMIDKVTNLRLKMGKNAPSDSEMIERIKKSDFMDELEDARKKFKVDKTIADTFPDKDDQGNMKIPNRKYSDESLDIVKEIIKMDREGKLDEILKRHNKSSVLDKYIREEVESPLRDSELSDDSAACQRNLDTIESKILAKLRVDGGDVSKDEDFNKLIEDYKFYKEKKKELDNKIWAEMPKVEYDTKSPLLPLKKVEIKTTPINPEVMKAIRPLSELK